MAREHYFWPAMKNNLKTAIDKCEVCQSTRPSLPVDTFITTTSEEPMAQVSVDLFQVGNSHYLLLVDHDSGYPKVTRLKSLTCETVIQWLKHWFDKFGYLWVLQSNQKTFLTKHLSTIFIQQIFFSFTFSIIFNKSFSSTFSSKPCTFSTTIVHLRLSVSLKTRFWEMQLTF